MSEGARAARPVPPDPARPTEDRYRTLFENSPVSIWDEDFSDVKRLLDGLRAVGVTDLSAFLDGNPGFVERCARAVRVVDVNAATLALHGAESKADLLAGLVGTFAPEAFPAFRRELEALWRGETAVRTDSVIRTLGGERRIVSVSLAVCPGHEETLSRVFVSLVDVTAQERSLAEAEDLYNNAPCGYHSLDADGGIVRINDVELQWLGYTREEVVGKLRITSLLTPASVESFRRNFPVFKERGWIRDVELDLVRKDGSVLPVMVSATAVRDAAGRFVMTRSTLVDLSERRKVEEQLRQAQKLEAVARLAGGVAHDFNNLLTIILSAGADLRETLGEHHPLREDAVAIEAAAQRAVALTRQLLAFSRRQPFEPRVLDLDQLAAGMEKMLRRIIGEDVELAVSGDGHPHRVQGDPGQLEQVLLNLAVNARDAMPQGGRLTVELRALPEAPPGAALGVGPCVLLTVRDTGVGMTPEVVAHLFEPFFTTKERGRGTGLGLSTVYGIARQNGGDVRVETAPGQGSAFHLYLPAVSGEADAAPPESAAEPDPRGSEVVLVAEDEPAVRSLFVRALGGLGYTVMEARDGEEALRAVAVGEPIDLLITDAVMPRMGGVELTQRLRAVRPGTAVLLVSGYTAAGAPLPSGPGAGFLPKPFTPAELARKVREVLDARR